MSRVFRRPMFRKGGSTNMNGIMSGIQDRETHSISDPMGVGGPTNRERYEAIMKKYEQPAIDPVSQLLISGGLRGLYETRGGSTAANLAMAFEEPTQELFRGLQGKKDMQREAELAALGLDIDEETERKRRMQAQQDAELKYQRDVKLAKQKTAGDIEVAKIKQKDPRTEQVTPNFENVVDRRTERYAESRNPAVASNPGETAFRITKFRREASPKIISRFKGFKPYFFDNKGNVVPLPTDAFNAGDIIYDAITKDFLIFDNAGGTYRLDPLTFEPQE